MTINVIFTCSRVRWAITGVWASSLPAWPTRSEGAPIPYQSALIVDCHSFPDKPLNRDLDRRLNRPDINIGTDEYHTPGFLLDFAYDYFGSRGLSIGVDWPYSGSILPARYYQKSKEVYSILIELNRKLYLDFQTCQKSPHYNELKQVVSQFLGEIKNSLEQH